MSEELYEFYKSDPDFNEYVNKIVKARRLGIFEALELLIVKEYAAWLKKTKEDRRQ